MPTRLVYTFNEVTTSPGFGSPQTKVRYQFNEVTTDPAFGPSKSKLRYQFVEVITQVTINNAPPYRPIIMACG